MNKSVRGAVEWDEEAGVFCFHVLGIPSGGLQPLPHLPDGFTLDLPDALAC
jgi:hypothetical protein